MSTVISVENLGKKYLLNHQGGQQPYLALRDVLADGCKNLCRRVLSPFSPLSVGPAPEEFWALRELSFEVKQGDRIGIIGRNGAGKSTLLKILSRITEPSTGSVRIRGRVASLLEVGTGFHPELTGRENIFLNGAILGMSRFEIRRKFDEIVDFAEIAQFLDTPVKRYSSGMYVRLAFAVAAHLEPEILVVDEVLAVGDAEFQKKCLGKMEHVSEQEGRTVLFVSHNIAAVSSLCSTGICLDKGRNRFIGPISECVAAYLGTGEIGKESDASDRDLPVRILALDVTGCDGPSRQLPHNKPFFVEARVAFKERMSKVYFALHIHDSDLQTLLFSRDFESDQAFLSEREPGTFLVRIAIPAPLLVPGLYRITLHIARSLPPVMITGAEYVCPFEIYDAGSQRAKMGYGWRGKIASELVWTCSPVRE